MPKVLKIDNNSVGLRIDKWVKLNEQLSYLQGCLDTVQYLMSGQLPKDGNHDGMKNHQPKTND